MLGCLAPLAHRLRVLIETLLHGLEHVLVLPSLNAPVRSARALSLERTLRACCGPIMTQRPATLLVRITIGQLLARWAAVDIFRRQIGEVLLAEAAICLRP